MKKNKIIFMLVFVLSMFGLTLKVNAEDDPCTYTNSGDCSTLISNYNSGKTKSINVTSGSTNTGNVTIYGKSVCSSSTCNVDYSGYDTYQELLKNKVVCSGGEKYINIQDAENNTTDYTSEINQANLNGTYYISEKYSVTCTGEAAAGAVELSNTGSTVTNNTSTSTNTSITTTGSGTKNPETGVETYYIVLGLVALLSYLVTIKVKKHNLFKNI